MIRIIALAFVGVVGLCNAAVIALFGYFALTEQGEPHIARGVLFLLAVPFVLITLPSLYLAFRTRYWAVGAALTLVGCVAGIYLWRTA